MAGSGLPRGSPSVGSREVRLVEDPLPGPRPSGARRSRGDRGAGRRTVLRLAGVLALTAALATVSELHETRSGSAELAGVAGVLAPVEGPVAPRWSTEVAVWPGLIVAAGLLVGVETLGTGVFGVVAIDPDDGSVVWRALQNEAGGRSAVQGCRLPRSGVAAGLAGAAEGSDVMCLVAHRAGARLDNRQPTFAVLLDARTGQVRQGAVPLGPGVDPVADAPGVGLVVDDASLPGTTVQLTPEGSLVALDTRSASVRWVLGPGLSRQPPLVLRTRVVALTPGHLLCLDGRTGRVVWTLPVTSDASGLLTDGRVVLTVQDDPGHGAVLTAVDVDDGYVVWSSDLPEDLHLFTLDGHLYGASADRLVAIG